MSIEALLRVMNDDQTKGAERLVMFVLADHADKDFTCWPGVETIARKANLTPKHTQRVLTALASRGLIERHVNRAPLKPGQRPDRRSNFYVLTLLTGGTSDTSGGYNQDLTGGTSDTERGPSEVPPNHHGTPSGTPSESREAAQLPVDKDEPFEGEFTECWAVYPRKVARKKALRAFQARRRAGVPAADLLAATRAYASSRIGEDPTYTQHGATFYGPSDAWVDWLEVYRANEAAGLLTTGQASVVTVNCSTCHGSTWRPGAGLDRPLDPVTDRCGVCAGTGTVSMEVTELEPF